MRRALPLLFSLGLFASLAAAPPPVQHRDLVASYSFNGHVRDASGHRVHCAGARPVYTADRYGHPRRAIVFDGTSYLDCGDVLHDLAFPLTVTAWVRVDRVNPFSTLLLATDHSLTHHAGVALGWQNGHLGVQIGDGGEASPYSRRTRGIRYDVVGRWVLVAGVLRSPDDLRLYVDGVRQDGYTSGGASRIVATDAPMRIGVGLIGAMDDLRLYRRALSAEELAAMARE